MISNDRCLEMLDGKTVEEMIHFTMEYMDEHPMIGIDIDKDPLCYMTWHLMQACYIIAYHQKDLEEQHHD